MNLKSTLALGSLLIASVFSAQVMALGSVSGYVCSAAYTAQNNAWFGNDGYVTVRLYNNQNCAGSYVGTYRYHSASAAQSGYSFTQSERRTLYSSMQTAANSGNRVTLFVSSDNGIFHTTVRPY